MHSILFLLPRSLIEKTSLREIFDGKIEDILEFPEECEHINLLLRRFNNNNSTSFGSESRTSSPLSFADQNCVNL